MLVERSCWDDELSKLDGALRAGDRASALDQLVAFDAALTRYVRSEERDVFPLLERLSAVPVRATETMRAEHRSLRRLLDTVGELVAREEPRRGLDALSALRSVLLLHVTKEEWVLSRARAPG